MEEDKRTLGFICPVCGQSVIIERTIFQLAAAVNHLPCPCGKSELVVEMAGSQCHMLVPCIFCEKDHKVTCSSNALLHQDLLAFSCAASGLDCCYVGREDRVFAAMGRLEGAVDKLIAHSHLEKGEQEEGSSFLDSVVMEEVLGEVRDIAARGSISCACGSREYGIRVGYSTVDLTCAQCGATLRLPAATADDIDDICCKNTLLIQEKEA